jgi:hypothetical protein
MHEFRFLFLFLCSPAPSGVPMIMLLIATTVVLAIAIDRIGLLLHRLGYLRVHMRFASRGGLESNDFDIDITSVKILMVIRS